MNFVAGMLLLARLPHGLTAEGVRISKNDGSGLVELPASASVAAMDPSHAALTQNSSDAASVEQNTGSSTKNNQEGPVVYRTISETEAMLVETDVFAMMMTLSDKDEKFAMASLWCPGVPKMKMRVYQMDR